MSQMLTMSFWDIFRMKMLNEDEMLCLAKRLYLRDFVSSNFLFVNNH